MVGAVCSFFGLFLFGGLAVLAHRLVAAAFNFLKTQTLHNEQV